MPIPKGIEGRVASLSDLMDTEVDIGAGSITIDQITSNNRVLYVGKQSGISQSTLTTVVTVPANGIKYITKIMCSGEESARWELYIDSVLKATLRTTDRNVIFDFNLPLKILAAEVLDVKVTHYGPDTTATFDATIYGYQAT
jgi:hypothetical protein